MTNEIIVVSGLPRSGTSMMMAMLKAGGLELLLDHRREADEDNPRGYYEYEKVKRLQKDASWLHEAGGKAVKIISALLVNLPPHYKYRVVFMRRYMEEILKSQGKMLERSGQQPVASDDKLAAFYRNHLRKIESWLAEQDNFTVCPISFNRLVLPDAQDEIQQLNAFFDNRLDMGKMAAVISNSLYRQRKM